MYLSSLQLRSINPAHYFVSGNVTIHEGAAIAPGVLIQADSDSHIVIRAGACIGLGSVLHAYNGTIEVGEGASIGAGVLMVGQVKIGARACVGAATTILDSAIEAESIVPSGSLIGDRSRPAELQVTEAQRPSEPPPIAAEVEADPWTEPPQQPPADDKAAGAGVYGQVYVNNLLVKLFPHQRSQQPPENGQSLNGHQ